MGHDPRKDAFNLAAAAHELVDLLNSPRTVRLRERDRILEQLGPVIRRHAVGLRDLINLLTNYIKAGEAARHVQRSLSGTANSSHWRAIRGMPVWFGNPVSPRESLSARQGPPREEVDVVIYLDDYKPFDLGEVEIAAMEFATELGYGDFSLAEEQVGSIYKRWVAKLRSGIESDLAQGLLEEVYERASLEIGGRARVENDAVKTESAVKLISSLAAIPNAVVRVGGILVIKQTVGDQPAVLVRELNSSEIRALERNPGIQRDPAHVLELLAVAVQQLADDPDATQLSRDL